MMALSFLAGPNFRVISCLCLWTAKWSSFVNLCVRSEKKTAGMIMMYMNKVWRTKLFLLKLVLKFCNVK